MRWKLVLFWGVLCCCLLCSCGTKKVITTSEHSDSVYVSRDYLESLRTSAERHDSIFVKDSVVVSVQGDTVYKYVEKVRYQWKYHTDTIIHDVARTDTMWMTKTDSIVAKEFVPVERKARWYESGLQWFGGICLLLIVGFIVNKVYKIYKSFKEGLL